MSSARRRWWNYLPLRLDGWVESHWPSRLRPEGTFDLLINQKPLNVRFKTLDATRTELVLTVPSASEPSDAERGCHE